MFNQNHPERRSGEVFLGNFVAKDFYASHYKTKRLGCTAYDINGRQLPSNYALFPCFVHVDELKEHMKTATYTQILRDWIKESENIDEQK